MTFDGIRRTLRVCHLALLLGATGSAFAAPPEVIKSSPHQATSITTGVSYNAAVRFLRQCTFGPTPALIAQVQALGFAGFLQTQFAAAPSLYNTPQWWEQQRYSIIRNEVVNADQLRQRMSLALSEIIVTSEFGQDADQSAFPVWLNTLQNDAFGLYGQVLRDVLKLPALNAFLTNIGNNATASSTQHVSQNLGRELLQLFTIGPYMLNLDGTQVTDSQGNPIAAYNNTIIDGVSRALTGWNFQSCSPGTCMWQMPLAPIESLHDETAKTLLNGTVTTPNQTANADLKLLVFNLESHQNMAPFISTRLIQSFVTSNPTPAYVSRIATVFKNDGAGNVGNLQAVILAILLDPEARAGDNPTVVTATGHVQEPALFLVGVMRAMQGTLQPSLASAPAGESSPGPWGAPDVVAMEDHVSSMGEQPLYSPSVFNFYSFTNALPGSTLLAPEMQLETSSSAIARANYVNDMLYGGMNAGIPMNTAWLTSDATSSPTQLVADLNNYLTAGRLNSATTQLIVNAVATIPSTDPADRIRQAFYLIFSSPQYQVIQ